MEQDETRIDDCLCWLESEISPIDVTMTFEPPWQPSMISPGVRSSLGFAEVN
ncbi:hypothetical protein [Bradyrhizobium sp. LVM 105]|uniref:hypothetical protein n=1 Tax=Bradyrhizobium sp. LVM 105 TaxID=2341115 RepID=UPI00196A9CD5|nr:hypothetical protein [Bradyrhizobium sp. LVM 105]